MSRPAGDAAGRPHDRPHELLDVAGLVIREAVLGAVVAIVAGRKESLSAGADFAAEAREAARFS